MTWPLSKAFVAGDGTLLTSHDVGWTRNSSWAGGADPKIYSNRLLGGSDVSRVYYYDDAPPSADQDVEATIYQISTDATRNHGVVARLASGSATGYMARYKYGTGVQLFKYTGSTSATQLGSTVSGNLSNGASMALRLQCIGTAIKVFKDDVEVISVTDGAVSGPGYAGVWLSGDGAGSVGSAISDWTATEAGASDTTAPVLSSPTGTATGSTTATVGATTDEGNGTMYAFVSTSATPPSATDLKAGTGATWSGSQAISSTGAKTLSATGLTASTGYYAHLIHTDAAANDSNIVTSAQFTTSAANAAPVWSGTPSAMSAKKGQALTPQDITSMVSDADLDTLSYSITGAPTGVTINSSSGIISGTPTAAPGVYACTVEADDGVNSPVSSSSFNITVTQCVLALSGAGYNFGDGNDVDTIAVENAVAWEVAVVADELPVTATLYHSASSTTSSTGYLSDIGDDDFVFGTTYVVQARRVSDGEWITFPIAAS